MFGYLRFILAYMVLLSHIQVTFFGLNIGVFAVVMFYILAGYVVSNLYLNILPNTKYKTLLFYKDRFKRIYPLYLYIATLTIIFLIFTNYANPKFSLLNLLLNLLIIPLNYYMYFDSTILQNPSWCLIPPTWSLGAELQAYILLSLIFLFKNLKYLFFIVTIFVYTLANFSIINADYFGYRFVAGVFFIFLLGNSLQKIKSNSCEDKFDKYLPLFTWIFSITLFFYFYLNSLFSFAYTKETLLGLIIGLPLIYIISKNNKKIKFDNFFGKLSYGIFLSHFLSIWILDYYGMSIKDNYFLIILTSLSILIAQIGIIFLENNSFPYKKS